MCPATAVGRKRVPGWRLDRDDAMTTRTTIGMAATGIETGRPKSRRVDRNRAGPTGIEADRVAGGDTATRRVTTIVFRFPWRPIGIGVQLVGVQFGE
jgi:hypothetical protein